MRFVCVEYDGITGNKIREMPFSTEEEALAFYTKARSAQRCVGPQAPYFGYPQKRED